MCLSALSDSHLPSLHGAGQVVILFVTGGRCQRSLVLVLFGRLDRIVAN